jgi:hypothetical protein
MATIGDTNQAANGRPVLLDEHARAIPWHRGRPDGSMRPGGIALPPGFLFVGRVGSGDNVWLWDRYDEAMRHSREDANWMLHDAFIMSLLQERMRGVTGLSWHLETPDEKDPGQLRVRDGMTRILKGMRDSRRFLAEIQWAVWYGRMGQQVRWEWNKFHDRPGEGMKGPERERRALTPAEFWLVDGDRIGHQYDHTPVILMGAMDTERLGKGAQIVTTTVGGMGVALRGSWRERFVLHKHNRRMVDFFNFEQAEAMHGVGLRNDLFWWNWLKLEWLGDITNFFNRVGLGVTLWTYPKGDPTALQNVQQAARDQSDRANIFIPVDPEDTHKRGTGVERLEVPTSGADALRTLIEYADKVMERLVVGQEASSKGSSSGLGNEANAELQKDTKLAIVKEDASFLAESLTGSETEPGLVWTIQHYTFPEADFPVRWVFDVESAASKEKLDAGKTLVDLAVKVKADEMRAAAGFSKPAEGDEVVEPPQQGGAGGGMPGMPGAPPGEGGEDPMAALMGGAGGGPPGAPPGAEPGGAPGGPPGAGGPPGGAPGGGGGGGDFLESLKMRKLAQAIRYARQRGRDDLALELEAAARRLSRSWRPKR